MIHNHILHASSDLEKGQLPPPSSFGIDVEALTRLNTVGYLECCFVWESKAGF